MKKLIDKLRLEQMLSQEEWIALIDGRTPALSEYLFTQAREVRHAYYGNDVYIRGLIEFTNYCKNDCLYCGIRKTNDLVPRYRLSEDDILSCCKTGYCLGFRTFVLQGGEDGYFSDTRLVSLIQRMKVEYSDCAITLSLGERTLASYQALYEAGADRYLLRHETYNKEHYGQLHPPNLSAEYRRECLWNLKNIGFQVGTGFMVGSPYQTTAHLAADLLFIKELNPQMIGIGPFIPHDTSIFAAYPAGTLELTLFMLALLRLLIPAALLPATTALGTIDETGREKGILAGANVVMPNLSPSTNRKHYALYNNKRSDGAEAAEGKKHLAKRIESIGYRVVTARGDSLNNTHKED